MDIIVAVRLGRARANKFLSGSVTDSLSNKPLPGATVFLSNATKNTSTNAEGTFKLVNVPPGQYTLVVTYIGYNTYKKTVLIGSDNQQLTIKMAVKPVNLTEVVIRPDQNREARLKLFFEAFVGTSKNAKECTIVNPKILSLYANVDSNTFEASAYDFLKIENQALGYRLNVLLDKFTINYTTKLLKYQGKIFYEELAGAPSQLKRWKKNRMVAYRGSLRQFYRSFLNGTTEASGFTAYPVTYVPNKYKMPDDIINKKLAQFKNERITDLDSLLYWKYQQRLASYTYNIGKEKITPQSLIRPSPVDGLHEIAFNGHLYLVSKQKTAVNPNNVTQYVYTVLTLPTGRAVFDANGILTNTNDVLYEGHDLEKLADMLPNDFIPDNEAPAFASTLKPVATRSDSAFFEKTYLHTDRETYTGGQDIWFKAYLTDAQRGQLYNSSNNLYVELISPDAKMISRKTVRLDDGLGKGDFHLDDTATPGTYRIRAYTNYMRNFGDNFLFEKKIEVYADQALSARDEIKAAAAKELAAGTPAVTSPAIMPGPAPAINFFPEGGSLIDGVPAMLAFKAVDAAGKGLALKGSITSANGTTLTDIICDSTGMGSVMITEAAGEHLKVNGTFGNGLPFATDLPTALAQGFSLYFKNTDSLVRVTVSTNQATLDEQQGRVLTLIGKIKGKAVYTAQLPLNNLASTIAIPTAGLPAGISSFTLYDALGKPQAERLVYIDGAKPVRLSIQSDKQNYAPKEKAALNIKATDQNNQPIKTSLSLAVVDAGLVPVNQENIVAYLNLSSEIRGHIDNPNKYFDEKNPYRKQQMDLLLLTQGWRDFLWKRLADSATKINYQAEHDISVSGRLRQTWVNKPISKANITLTAWKARGDKLYTANTDSAGRFLFSNMPLFGDNEIAITAANNIGQKIGYIIVDTATTDGYPIKKMPVLGIAYPPVFKEAIAQRAAILKKFSLADTVHLGEVLIRKFVAGRTLSDTTFKITKADYPLKYLRDYMLEKIPGAQRAPSAPEVVIFYGMGPSFVSPNATQAGGQYVPRLPFFSTEGPNAKRMTPTQYYAKNARNDFFNIPLDRIVSIEFIHNRNRDGIMQGPPPPRFDGPDWFDGILGDYFDVFLTLKPGAFDRQGLGTINASINGYDEAREFYAPKYDTPSNKPDYRTTIHWEPNITTDDKGEAIITYYNADPKTKIRIVAEGITDKGIPVSGTATYEVK